MIYNLIKKSQAFESLVNEDNLLNYAQRVNDKQIIPFLIDCFLNSTID